MRISLVVAAAIALVAIGGVGGAAAQAPQLAVSVPASELIAIDGDSLYTSNGTTVSVTSLAGGQSRTIYRAARGSLVDIQAHGGALGIFTYQVGRKTETSRVLRYSSATGKVSVIGTSRMPRKMKDRSCGATTSLAEAFNGGVLAITTRFCFSAMPARTTIRLASDTGTSTVFASNERGLALARIGGIAFDASLRGSKLALSGAGAGVWDTQSIQFVQLEKVSSQHIFQLSTSASGEILTSRTFGTGGRLFSAAAAYAQNVPIARSGKLMRSDFCGDIVMRSALFLGRRSVRTEISLLANPYAVAAVPNPDPLVVPGQTIQTAACDADKVALLTQIGKRYEVHTAPIRN